MLADPGFGRVYAYSATGALLSHWAMRRTLLGTLVSPTAFGVDGTGRVSLLALSGYTLSTYTPSGQLIRSWCAGCNMPGVGWPNGMTVDRAGNVYAAFPGEVVEFSSIGIPLRSWGNGSPSGKGHFSNVSGLAVDGHGNLYVADTGENTLQVFSPSRRVLAYWRGLGPKSARFRLPGEVAVDNRGNIYLIDEMGVLELAPLAAR